MEELLVEIPQGELKGKQGRDHKGGIFRSFQGIPYARPPVGELRFKAPQQCEHWQGVLDCTKQGNESISKHFILQRDIGAEDCLFVNVYTPQGAQSRPVMVFIHGGGLTMGSSNTDMYGPEYIVAQDVVLVTFNYRLGLLGFLSLEDPALGVPGNNGLKDVVQALKWVQENIGHFGGDAGNVTIFGESAGSGVVHLLMLSPMATGLFHKAIMQSGNALNQWMYGSRCAKAIGHAMALDSGNEREILKTLREMPAEKILEVQSRVPDSAGVHEDRPFSFVVEKPSNEPAFLTEDPINIILSGNYNKVPLIIGYNISEGMMMHVEKNMADVKFEFAKKFETKIPSYYKVPRGSKLANEIADKIKQFYFPNTEPSEENIDSYYQLETDIWFYRGIYVGLLNHLKHTTEPVYFYRFSVDGELNVYKKFGKIQHPGASHCDELGYLFTTTLLPESRIGHLEETTIDRMVGFWTNFAKTGNPNADKKSETIDVTWPQAKQDELNYLDIGAALRTGVDPDIERMKFWDEISKLCPQNKEM